MLIRHEQQIRLSKLLLDKYSIKSPKNLKTFKISGTWLITHIDITLLEPTNKPAKTALPAVPEEAESIVIPRLARDEWGLIERIGQ